VLTATITSITLKSLKGKAIPQLIEEGEGLATGVEWARGLARTTSGSAWRSTAQRGGCQDRPTVGEKAEKPAAAGAGRARREVFDVSC